MALPTNELAYRKPWLAPAAVAILAAGACVVLSVRDPNNGGYPVCPTRALTGMACPGCGTLRGLNALLHGNVTGAFGYNALMVLALPWVLYTWVAWWARTAGRPLPAITLSGTSTWVVFAGIVAFTALRNTPVAPFNWLAP